MEVGLRSRCAAPRPASPVTWSRDAGFQPSSSGGYSLLAVYLLPSGLRPFPGPVCCSGAVSFWKGADGFCCAGAEADDGGLVAEGVAVSVSLRCARAGGQGSETVAGKPGEAGFVGVPRHRGGWCSLAADSVLKRWSYQGAQVSTTHIDISLGEHDLHWDNVTVTPEPGGNPSVQLRAYLTRDEYVYALQASAVSEPQCPLTLVIGGQTFSLEGTPRIKHDGNYWFADCRVQVSSETLTAISQALARQELTGT